MVKYRVLITEPIHKVGVDILKKETDIIQLPQGSSIQDLLTTAPKVDAIVTRGPMELTREVFRSSPRLRVVGLHGIGYDHIDVNAAKEMGKIVFNTPDALTVSVAEMALALMLSLIRRIVSSDKAVRAGEWQRKYDDLVGNELMGKKIGIIGMGRIGEALARRLNCFKVSIKYFDIIRKQELEKELKIEYGSIDDILEVSDVITLHIPASPKTHHLINRRRFEKMKKGVYIVNTARGSVIDQDALVEALKSGKVAGAALDVFQEEPLSKVHPLTEMDNVILTPHIGASTTEAMMRMAIQVTEEVLKALKGEEPSNRIV
jgi:D-3-phosphoglycerate dehydrogenase